MREKESFNVSADDLCQHEGINDIKNARYFFLRMKATNTCNRNGVCVFPKNDNLRLQPPLIGPRHSGDVSAILYGRREVAVYAGYQKKKTGKVCRSSFMSLNSLCGAI